MHSIFTSTREYSVDPGRNAPLTAPSRYNKGDIVLGLEFGDHIGDW